MSVLNPYIVVGNGLEAIEWYGKAFGAEKLDVAMTPDGGRVMNAQLSINGGVFMINDEFPEWGGELCPAKSGAKCPMTVHINSENIDADFERAVAAGAKVIMPLENMFWGDRFGQVEDPWGYRWSMGQQIAQPSHEEMMAGAEEAFKQE